MVGCVVPGPACAAPRAPDSATAGPLSLWPAGVETGRATHLHFGQQPGRRLAFLLAPFGGEVRTFNEPASAELVKCAHNIYNATKISFWNEMWLVAQAYGIDADPVASTVAASSEGSINPLYGIRGGAPYGGVCLPKDTCGFLGFAATIGVDMPLLRAVVEVNDRMEALTGHELDSVVDSVVERDMSGADVA